MTLFNIKTGVCDQIFLFHICANFHTKVKKLNMTWKFECFQSHCYILKELHEFLCTMGALTIFGEGSFVFNFNFFFGKLWIGDKVIWVCVYNLGGDWENKMS